MTEPLNYYKVLGVLPGADQIVVTAAYRALAGYYHPDRWKGDKDFATQRMAEINVAYGVLGDSFKRAEYDQRDDNSSTPFERAETDDAFDAALSEIEVQWETAAAIIPDLREIRQRLSKTANRLAFEFVTTILETKDFNNRVALASELESRFLELHFGTNLEIKSFAKKLIQIGNKNAIRSLNRYVDVLGSNSDPKEIIQKVIKDHDLEQFFSDLDRAKRVEDLKKYVLNSNYIQYAIELVKSSNLAVVETEVGFFRAKKYDVFSSERVDGQIEVVLTNVNAAQLIDWVRAKLCS
jgi:DnaJ domain